MPPMFLFYMSTWTTVKIIVGVLSFILLILVLGIKLGSHGHHTSQPDTTITIHNGVPDTVITIYKR